MESEKNYESSQENDQREAWRKPRSEECQTENCTRPVDLADGNHCSVHSTKLKLKAMQQARPSQEIKKVTGPRCSAIANKGIKTATDFADFMSALMSDVVEDRIDPNIAKTACLAGDKLLKVVEMQAKYGTSNRDGSKTLNLSSGEKEK
jgi:hypothetical protein